MELMAVHAAMMREHPEGVLGAGGKAIALARDHAARRLQHNLQAQARHKRCGCPVLV